MKKNTLILRQKKTKSLFFIVLKTLFESPLLSSTGGVKFLALKKQFPFFSEKSMLVLNGEQKENFTSNPRNDANLFLFLQLLFTKKGWRKIYEAFWK